MMSRFISTRGANDVSFRDALFAGLAPDGGLYVPAQPRSLGHPPPEAGHSVLATALWAAEVLVPGLPAGTRKRVLSGALDFPLPLVEVEPNLHVLELFHGPTHAFKDVGARFMARAMAELETGGDLHTVLVATSGDTGGAVADAFHGLSGFRVAALFPKDGISERQRRQMTTLGDNVLAIGVQGTFDDCQRLAKSAFMDDATRARFALTSANSINIGRLLPQSLYYIHAAAALGWASAPARFVVPCGNLGNLCAGLLASRAGLPTEMFLAATNLNSMFVQYLASGLLEPRASVGTCSNAMDVGNPSNLERIAWLYRGDALRLQSEVTATAVDDTETVACIADTYARTGYVLDPHTAVAYRANQRDPRNSDGPTIVLATAHPAKFPEVVERAIGRKVTAPDALAAKMQAEESMMLIPPDLTALAKTLDEWEHP